MPRRHLKKDDRTTLCGVSMNPKFQKALAPDRQSVTCGACELVSRPKTEKPKPKIEIDFSGIGGPEMGMGGMAPHAPHAPHAEHAPAPAAAAAAAPAARPE